MSSNETGAKDAHAAAPRRGRPHGSLGLPPHLRHYQKFGLHIGAGRLTRELWEAVHNDAAAMRYIASKCKDADRFAGWERGERRYTVERQCSNVFTDPVWGQQQCSSQTRLVRDGSCAACADRRSPVRWTAGGEMDHLSMMRERQAADLPPRRSRDHWLGQKDAERAERAGEFREVRHGKYAARIHPTGRLEVWDVTGWRTDDLAKLAREQGDPFFRFAQVFDLRVECTGRGSGCPCVL